MWHSYIFRKCCKFWHCTPLSSQKMCSKKTKNMTSNSCSVRPEKFHPYGQKCPITKIYRLPRFNTFRAHPEHTLRAHPESTQKSLRDHSEKDNSERKNGREHKREHSLHLWSAPKSLDVNFYRYFWIGRPDAPRFQLWILFANAWTNFCKQGQDLR